MKSFKQYIKETPDQVWSYNDGSLLARHNDPDAYPFGIIDNILFYQHRESHYILGTKIGIHSKFDFDDFFHFDHDDISYVAFGELKYDRSVWVDLPFILRRDDFHISGRLWSDKHIISFWQEFDKVTPYLPLIIKFIEEFKINPIDMKYEFIDSDKLYTWNELGVDELDPNDLKSPEDIKRDQAIQHALSPMLKAPKTNPPEMKRRGKLIPFKGMQLSPGGRPVIGDSVQTFKDYINE